MSAQKLYEWAVVGAGPAGITVVGKLLDDGVSPDKIVWIDPNFSVGDFGQLWGAVNSNTTVENFLDYFTGIKSFQYKKECADVILNSKAKTGFTLLSDVSTPLQKITENLKKAVNCEQAMVQGISVANGRWQLQTENEPVQAAKVVLAIGSEPKSLDYPSVKMIPIADALDPKKLKQMCNVNDEVAVFGSSHSSMIIIRHLVELGVQRIINFYRSPIRYALRMEGWTLYDNTGLKGETAQWVHENISQNILPNIQRYQATNDNIEHHLPLCSKVVYAVGFKRRNINIRGISLNDYDPSNGIIAPGLFGLGIAFPKAVMDPLGNQEYDVGLLKFSRTLNQVMPVWRQYDL